MIQQHCTPKQWWGPTLSIPKNGALPLCTLLVFLYLAPNPIPMLLVWAALPKNAKFSSQRNGWSDMARLDWGWSFNVWWLNASYVLLSLREAGSALLPSHHPL